MSPDGNTGPASTTPAGRYSRICPSCSEEFKTNHPRQIYCLNPYKRKRQNIRYYLRHQDRIRATSRLYQRTLRKSAKGDQGQ